MCLLTAAGASTPPPVPTTSAAAVAPAPAKVDPPRSATSAISRLGLPTKPSVPSPLSGAPATSLRAVGVGLPKKPSFNAFGKATSRGPARATAAGMMGEEEEETKALYKPEEGLTIESGLEPDKPTAEQLEQLRLKDEAIARAMKKEGDDENGMDVDGQAEHKPYGSGGQEDDDDDDNDNDDDELGDGGPVVKSAPMTSAQREAEREARDASEAEAQKAKMEIDDGTAADLAAAKQEEDEEDIDPLDAFMLDVKKEVKKVDKEDAQKIFGKTPAGKASATANGPFATSNGVSTEGDVKGKGKKQATGLIDAYADGSDSEPEAPDMDDVDKASLRPEDILALAQKKLKRKELPSIDHTRMGYEPFRKAFYHPPPEVAEMSNEEADALRVELDNIKIRGVDCPKPITRWSHCGLPAVW